ncbi:MAG TPA: cytochrome P450, partial [Candidatus Binataceae bacterium]|nr:cytochrome P450 [Candidatus Binataceae bacterium]
VAGTTMSIESSELNAGTIDLDLRYKFDFTDPAVSADPFPYYRALLATPPIIAQRQIPWAIVSRYDDVVKVLRDHQGYSSVNPHLPGTEGYDAFKDIPVMTFVDEPTHARLRRVAAPSLAVRRMENMAPRFLELVDGILDEHWQGKREVDAVCYLAQELPIRAFGDLLAIPKSENETLRALGVGRPRGDNKIDFYDPNFMQSRAEFIHKLVRMRKGERGGQDLISLAIAAHETNEKIDDLELFGMVMVLVTGGIGTTSDLIGGAIYQMLRRPALYNAIKHDRALVSVLLEETLRYDGPIHTLFRVTTRDIEVGGLQIPVRTPVCVVNGAANRDPRKFPNPEEFDITRDLNDQIGFGEGIHFCVGAAPARVEARVAVERILERFPRIRIADGFTPTYNNNAFGRGLATLPLILD